MLFETLLTLLREQGLLKRRGRQRTDSTHVLAAVQTLNRLELVGETMRAALNRLAVVAPTWLRTIAPPEWFDRYAARCEEYRLPDTETQRQALGQTIGADGFRLLQAVYAPDAPACLASVPAVDLLRQVWVQQYYGPHWIAWRAQEDSPPTAQVICSPYDPAARYGTTRDVTWIGYKVHLTETCDADTPHLITDVTTTSATTLDVATTPSIQQTLADHDRLPSIHFMDAGYVDADHLRTSRMKHQVAICGPAMVETSWHARAGTGYAASAFQIDWAAQRATCPQGTASTGWKTGRDRNGTAVVKIAFPATTCASCSARSDCTRARTAGRELTVRTEAAHTALQAARKQQATTGFWQPSAARAGIEGTLSQGIRRGDLRQARYVGEAKTRLQHLLIATALNLIRAVTWLLELPCASTRVSRFAALAPAPT